MAQHMHASNLEFIWWMERWSDYELKMVLMAVGNCEWHLDGTRLIWNNITLLNTQLALGADHLSNTPVKAHCTRGKITCGYDPGLPPLIAQPTDQLLKAASTRKYPQALQILQPELFALMIKGSSGPRTFDKHLDTGHGSAAGCAFSIPQRPGSRHRPSETTGTGHLTR